MWLENSSKRKQLMWLGESQGHFFREVGVVVGWKGMKVYKAFLSSILFLPLSPHFLNVIPGKGFHLKQIFYYISIV